MTRARMDVTLGVGLLLVLQVLLGFGAVGLLSRMGPAISVILRDNDASMAAAEEMLAILALPHTDRKARQRFWQQLQFAEQNITEPGEAIELKTLRRVGGRALQGDHGASREAVEALRSLAAINRDGMTRSGSAARRLGSAGAWAGTLLALASALAALLVMRRLHRRLVVPLVELHATLRARADGDLLRRCRVVDAPLEFIELRDRINAMLDTKAPEQHRDDRKRGQLDRAAVLALLDRQITPAAVLNGDGALVAANDRALEALAAEDGFREAMGGAVSEAVRTRGDTPLVEQRDGLEATRLEGDVGWLLVARCEGPTLPPGGRPSDLVHSEAVVDIPPAADAPAAEGPGEVPGTMQPDDSPPHLRDGPSAGAAEG